MSARTSATSSSPATPTTPSTRACLAPVRTAPGSARPPRSSPRAVTTMVLPAPVSPVIAVKPGPSSSTDSSITPRAVIRISSSIVDGPPATVSGGAAPPCDRQLELRDEPVGERRLVQPREEHRRVAPAYLDPGTRRQLDRPAPVAPQDTSTVGDDLDGQHRGRC